MGIYIFEILILIMLIPISRLRLNVSKRIIQGNNLYLFFAFACLLFVSGLRGKYIGSDTFTYYHYYEVIAETNSLKEAFRYNVSCPVYTTYEFILTLFIKNPQTITFCNSLVICWFTGRLIYESKCNSVIATILFVVLSLHYVSMNGTRQMMAVVIVANGIYEIVSNRNYILGMIFSFIAVGIHNTAIIAMVFLLSFFIIEKIKHDFNIIYFGSLLIGGLVSIGITFFINIFATYFGYFSGYLDGSMSANTFSRDGGGRIALLYLFLLFITFLYYLAERNNINRRKDFLYRIIPALNVGIMLGLVNAKNMLLNRMNWYFLIFYIVSIPQIVGKYKKENRIIFYMIIFMILFAYCFLQLIENKSGIVPYKFYWEML